MSAEHYYESDVTEHGLKSFWVKVTVGDAIAAEDAEDARERFILSHFHQGALSGKGDPNGYGMFESEVIAGPKFHLRKKDAPVRCDKCDQDIVPEEFALHHSGECIDIREAAVKAMVEEFFGEEE